ncbi:phosphomannomutase/phosphoglucomutase [Abditibacteriota bacterium]|nr:phosphomannomutase/phosphoglucomutase [Abditibacteriota bacterium]
MAHSSQLMVSVSGIRGVVGASLTPGVALDFVQSYTAYLRESNPQPLVLLARDTRPTGEMMRHAALAGLVAGGARVLDLGVVSTPTLQYAIKRLGAQGAICITASHNPVEWNALKFFQPTGMYLDKAQGNEVIRRDIAKEFACNTWQGMGTLETDTDGEAIEAHLQKILSLVDVEKIRARQFKVVLDACNGAGGTISPLLLERLGCEVTIINGDLHGVFAHNPEPLNENMVQLMDAMKAHGADIGFAHDADADRVAVVTNDGDPIGEDYSLVWGVAHVLKNRTKGPVVTNLSTSSAVETLAEQYGCECIRTPVGDANVSGKMLEISAAIGGEGNGGVIWPEMQLGRDGIAAIGLVLEFLAVEGKTAAQIHAELPRYTILKTTHDLPREKLLPLFAHLKAKYTQATIDERDGLRLNFDDKSWVHVRGSGTEPIVRLILEARTPEQAQSLQSEFKAEIASLA